MATRTEILAALEAHKLANGLGSEDVRAIIKRAIGIDGLPEDFTDEQASAVLREVGQGTVGEVLASLSRQVFAKRRSLE
jgi:hypothetical protein